MSQPSQHKQSNSIYLSIRALLEWLLVFLLSPLILLMILIISFVIRIGQGKHVFFVQNRPGKNGKIFPLIKFRTMLEDKNEFRLTEEQDMRVTRLGRFLRKYHIDEIPQLINVLLGQLSLIGPRPVPLELYEGYKNLIPGYDNRHSIRPGITGLAQVTLGYTQTLEGEKEKWELDMIYIRNPSLLLDIKIMWRTFFKGDLLSQTKVNRSV